MSVPVLLHLLALLPSLERGLVMVQSEVADRLAAGPGSKVYGVPSVKAAWYADVRRAGAIGRTVFWPAPNVDSGLVAWTRREPPQPVALDIDRAGELKSWRFSRAKVSISANIAYEDAQAAMDRRLKLKEERLRAQFTAMETALNSTQSSMSWLNGQISGLASWNS